MKEIPTPKEVLKKLEEKEEKELELFFGDILRNIYTFNGSPVTIEVYRSLTSKVETKLKQIFLSKDWLLSFERKQNQKDGVSTNITFQENKQINERIN